MITRRLNTKRSGLTLLEVILALGLTVVVMLLLGGLIAIYQGSLDIGRDNIRQARIARAILAMIADDLRGVIRNSQQDDAASLKEFLSSTSSTPAGASGAQGANQPGGGASPTAGGTLAGAAGAGSSDSTSTGSATDTTDASMETTTSTLQPGVYGSESSIEIDVSRPPRIEEYAAELVNPLSGTLTDIPSDMKTVSYFVQAPQLDGVQDPLAGLSGPVATGADSAGAGIAGSALMQNGGLVRRAIDRGVYRWAAENGQIAQVNKTGQIVAPEIIALSFSYFDGQQWTTTWDSSVSGIPWAVNISIYMQHAKAARENPVPAGVSMLALTSGIMAESGIEMYSMMVNIPGAQSLMTPSEQQSTTTTDASSTSSLGF
ncbi:MAG: hypothetical protein NTW52_17265 [Planctomycetota bacterium]|nr:hypothetical protein [Planctomycetota bacterium]